MHDPVLASTGISYERSWIERHLRSNGNFDPVTRQPLTLQQLTPNIALKAACEAWLIEHPGTFEEGMWEVL